MRIYLHIGLHVAGATRVQAVLAEKRAQLLDKGVLVPRAAGAKNHTRLFMAVTDPDHVDPLRYNRGYIGAAKQAQLRETLLEDLRRDVAQHSPHTLILSAHQLGTQLSRRSELDRLKALLAPLSEDIRIVAHLDAQARMLAEVFAAQVLEGRAAGLAREVEMTRENSWWQAALETLPPVDPQAGQFEESQGAPFWLDYLALQEFWEEVFGAGSVTFRPYDPARFGSADVTEEIRAAFGIDGQIGRVAEQRPDAPIPAAWLTRGRQFNALLLRLLAQGNHILPRKLWRQMIQDLQVDGPPIDPARLGAVTRFFAADNARLCARHADLSPALFDVEISSEDWAEADPQMGFRASQYLLAFLHRIEKATREERAAREGDLQAHRSARAAQETDTPAAPSARAQRLMPPLALKNFEMLQGSSFKPHNRIGSLDETTPMPPYAETPVRTLPKGRSSNVIVGCMKDEAPYILEWVAYHRMIGVDHFLIYTNGCSDGTAELLDRLQELGLLQHRNNDNWKGNSPQQYALNQALKEPVIKQADWVIHIDVDEFINVRCGNGTLADFFDHVPEATNVAMTWRLFGHNGVTALADRPVIAQFDHCAPQFCPKPHTVWGFKTMFKPIGAYQKISCHRPNKLAEDKRAQVTWVNGSGQDMTAEVVDNGWRSSKKSIGYDLLQLNHYALRSAESFLVKRQRGRALHVDRSIGLNYWIRMDWNDHRDITIQRNLPRMQAELARLMQDKTLRDLHAAGLDWHRTKAAELHQRAEFEELYQQALEIDLSATERVAWALSLDLES
ncbi:glycosyltransferase family 2 protein [Epibacterium sp. MM17-32]|uniref:glycosyltransferase family 2 protein n=1 Tax=Epibacterium sp. MM17-32 TaxID=2917734 RepID=UPI001EF58626|nr:glycosyltransferase family 2 protein [Epibacterium sp. MM17-32]MCG7629430.1 glycosyltransferase family 2 protein [Epibacterium sp. MM17-32]